MRSSLSRRQRQRLKRLAPRIARKLVPTVILRGDGGTLAKVEDARASFVLEATIAESLSAGGTPVFRRLSDKEAECFPFVGAGDHGSPWLACALGLDGRVSVVVRHLDDQWARGVLLVEFASLCINSDVPALADVYGRA